MDNPCTAKNCDLSDEAILRAMQEMSSYVDMTPEDFMEIYRHAYGHAHAMITTKPADTNLPNTQSCKSARLFGDLRAFFLKMKGAEHSPPRVGLPEICWSWAGGFLGTAFVAYCNYRLLEKSETQLLVGSFGATAVLLYGAIKSPLAQPRNILGGHIISALIGVACYRCLPADLWLAAALAVATAIACMHATKTLHPPGGATALIAVIGGDNIHALGFLYALIPVGSGALMMLLVGLMVNNMSKQRRYPEYWW